MLGGVDAVRARARRAAPGADAGASARRLGAGRVRAARRVHGAFDHVVADAVGLVAGGQPHVRVPGRVRRRPGARPARPGSWGALLVGVAISAVALCGWSLLTKVFPAAFATEETFARLRPPFDYWNSVGLAAALGIPPLLWLGARRSGHAAAQRARVARRSGSSSVCLMLAYSRGALLAAGLGLAALAGDRPAAPARAGRCSAACWSRPCRSSRGCSRRTAWPPIGATMALRVDAGQALRRAAAADGGRADRRRPRRRFPLRRAAPEPTPRGSAPAACSSPRSPPSRPSRS